MGALANEVRAALENALDSASQKIEQAALELKLKAETVDVTIPGRQVQMGCRHPMNTALDEFKEIFIGMGFTVLDGPEIELAELNFDRLNAEEGHPSRDWSDTFYFDTDERVMLRSQTSPMQVRAMDSMELPIRMIAPGRVYRKDEVDATHFPFTEPSCEMDVQCHKCDGAGCATCKGEGWIELLGAGMIHPRVLEMAGIDPEEWSGWAFGFGLDRLAMLRYKIDDLRLIFENDVRFLEQF